MTGESPGENPYAAPAEGQPSATADDSSLQPIWGITRTYQCFVACLWFVMICCAMHALLTAFVLSRDDLASPVRFSLNMGVNFVALLLTRLQYRWSLARIRKDE